MNHAALAAAMAAGVLLLQGALEQMDRVWEDRRAYRAWVKAACLPERDGQTAVMKQVDGKLECRTFENMGYARAPVMVSATTTEWQQ